MALTFIMPTGPLFIGTALSYFLFGAFFIQLFVYITTFASSDRKLFVGLVLLITVIEVLHLVFTTHTAYTILAEGFGDLTKLTSSPWSGSALPALNGFVSLLTQVFFAWRINRLGNNRFALISGILITLLAFMQCAAAVGVTVQFVKVHLEIELLRTLKRTVIVWLAGTLACDVLMTVSVVVVLMGYRRSTSYQASKGLIDTFITHTVENGLLTTVCAMLNIVFFLVYPNNFLYVCVEFILGRLYANVLMSTLNRRDRTRITARTADQDIQTGESSKNRVPLTHLRSFRSVRGRPSGPKVYPVVSITREVEIDDDSTSIHRKDQKDTLRYPSRIDAVMFGF